MLEVLKFILKCVIQFVSMLFKIDVGFTNLGVVMCICYILIAYRFLCRLVLILRFAR